MLDPLLDAYFILRPYLPQRLRMGVRRLLYRRQRRTAAFGLFDSLATQPPHWWVGWPENKRFAFAITHDVESQKGLDRCRQLAATEMRMGFRSCFNFIPEGNYETPESLRDFLTNRGFEVGVHDLSHDGKLYRSRKKFASHADRINRYLQDWEAVGFRSGFMLHDLDWLQDLNVLYDSSTFDNDPFEPQPDGMRTIFPFWVERGDGSGYVELPYTLPQDSTLFLLLREKGIDTWQRKLDWIAEHGGLALVIVHPDYIDFEGADQPLEYASRLYTDILRYVRERYQTEAWCALPREIATYVCGVKSGLYASADGFDSMVAARPAGRVVAP
jgi:hypothetical protein